MKPDGGKSSTYRTKCVVAMFHDNMANVQGPKQHQYRRDYFCKSMKLDDGYGVEVCGHRNERIEAK
jgi:hypothetical protein